MDKFLALFLFALVLLSSSEVLAKRHKGRRELSSSVTVNSTTTGRCPRKPMVLTSTNGVLKTPGFPREYKKNLLCTWHIKLPKGYNVRLKFRREFKVESSDGCRKDALMVADNKHFRKAKIYCGSYKPYGLLSSKNELWVKFKTDESKQDKGFYLSYIAVDANECLREVCKFPSLCRNMVGSYSCDCPDGYILKGGKNSGKCKDIDECRLGQSNCEHYCVNTEGSFHCLCKEGYRVAPDGSSCRDVNECDRNNGRCSHVCLNNKGSFKCACPVGFTLQSDRMTCYPDLMFKQPQYMSYVRENVAEGTVVLRLEAITTFPKRKKIEYQIISENLQRNSKPTMFGIDQKSGDIVVIGKLDREYMSQYLLEVVANFDVSSDGKVRRSANTFVLIKVLDENDNDPSFSHKEYTVFVPCYITPGTIMYRMKAVDRDVGRFGNVSYRFSPRNDFFDIHPLNGNIRVVKELTPLCGSSEVDGLVNITVEASDQGEPPRTAQASMHFIIKTQIKSGYDARVNFEQLESVGDVSVKRRINDEAGNDLDSKHKRDVRRQNGGS